MSALYRAPIFFLTSLRGGWRLALSAMFAETVFRVVTSGFYGAATQALRKLEPAWLAVLIILLLAPAAVQLLEYAVHHLHGTPNVKTGVLVSSAMTGIASLFNWYAMRHGTMLTGKEGQSFLADLRSLPWILWRFLSAGPNALLRRIRGKS